MIKYVCGLLAALLACLPMAALAEAPVDKGVIDAFTDTWVCEGPEGYAAEIWYEDGAFHCMGTRFIAADEGYSFEFERCDYDAQAGALVCSGGVLYHESYSEAQGRIISEEVASGFDATLTVDENHRLHWTGSGDAIPDQRFAPLDEVGEAAWYDDGNGDDDGDDTGEDDAGDAFVGDWMCERASIYIDEDDGVYTVRVTWGSSAFEEVFWDYSCTLDTQGALTGVGKKSTETYDDEGNVVARNVEYTDGAATFVLDGDFLLWNDAKEDAAQGMRFERVEPEGDSDEDFDRDAE